jgi:diguanylate cyclase (GGDEF)-like protein/PAS domain S-box-containing protein
MSEQQAIIRVLQAENARLQQREALYHSLYDAMNEGVALHTMITDASGTPIDYRILEINPAFTLITGLPRSATVGRPASDVYGTGVPPHLEEYARVVATGKSVTFQTTFAPLQKTFQITAVATAPDQFATILTDITIRERTQTALRASEARYRAVSELTSDFAFALTVNPDGSPETEWITDAFTRITGLTRADANDPEKMRSIVHPDDISYLAQHQAQVLAGHDTGIVEFRILRQGEVRWLRHYFKPVWDSRQERVVRIYGAAQDITEQKRIETALQRRDRILEAISAVAASFLDTGSFHQNMQLLLERLGTTAEVSRVYVFENICTSAESLAMRQLCEWVAPEISPQIDNPVLQDLPYQMGGFVRWEALLRQGNAIYGEVCNFPPEERMMLHAQNIQSIAVVPIFLDHHWWGFIGFDDCVQERAWSMSELDTLRTAAGVVGGAIQRQQIALALQTSEEKYRTLFDRVPIALCRSTPDGRFLDVNQAMVQLLGYATREALLAVHLSDLYVDPAERRHWQDCIERGEDVHNFEIRFYRRDGTVIWVNIHIHAVRDDTGRVIAYEASLEDITDRKAYQQQIEQLAFTDPLTSLANRRHLYEAGAAALLADPERTALLYLDLDRFKAFNDTLGHDAGDDLLVQVTRRLQEGVVQGGLLARIGGDEFAVLLTDTDREAAVALAETLLDQLRHPFDLPDLRVYLNGSIGIALGTVGLPGFSMLLTRADIAMYRAKRTRTGVQVHDPVNGGLAPEQMHIEAEFRQALMAGHMLLYYQPILDMETQQLFGVEALVRWPHPTYGLLTPGRFLPLAEEIGLLGVLDIWVLQAALTQAARWQTIGVPRTVTVNLSAPSFRRVDLVEHVAALLNTTGVAAERLVIELTEQIALHDLSLTYQVLTELQALGVRVALDDFGTGYASLTHLRKLPIDILKVERGFTAGIGHNHKDEAVLRAVLALGEGLNMIVITEGVEHEAQRAWLQAAGGRHIQGYLIGRPAAAEEFDRPYSAVHSA